MPRLTYARQLNLINKAHRTATPLAEVLAAAGHTYDDLVYKTTIGRSPRGPASLSLSDFEHEQGAPDFVSFFTGCGGMDLGLSAVGWGHKAAFEFNELFCKTLRKNRPNWRVFGPPVHPGDVSEVSQVAQTLSEVIQRPFPGVFVGGPPCQPFSIAANQRFAKWGDNFKRVGFSHAQNGNLLFDFVALIVHFRPRAFIVENVPGLRDIDGGSQLARAYSMLATEGYTVQDPLLVNAADFGVPQERHRLFIVGARSPRPFATPQALAKRPICARSLRLVGRPLNHETREHRADSIRRYMELEYGSRDQLGRVDRLDPNLPAKTVIAGGTNGGGRSHLHPEIPHTLSVRECARLQTFPDDYVFVGPTARQFTQVGNAVPPVLAAQIGRAVHHSYF